MVTVVEPVGTGNGGDPNTNTQVPGTIEDDVPVTASASSNWINLTNGDLNDGSNTTQAGGSASIFSFIRFSNFGFSVPAEATLLGVEVVVEWAAQSSSFVEDTLQLAWGASAANLSTTNQFAGAGSIPAAGVVSTFGGASDLWGETALVLTPTVLNSSDFGFVLKVDRLGGSARTCGIDYGQMRLHYDAPVVAQYTPQVIVVT